MRSELSARVRRCTQLHEYEQHTVQYVYYTSRPQGRNVRTILLTLIKMRARVQRCSLRVMMTSYESNTNYCCNKRILSLSSFEPAYTYPLRVRCVVHWATERDTDFMLCSLSHSSVFMSS